VVQPELKQEDLLRRITNRIRQSLELQEILTATVSEIRTVLGTDRVMVYRFHKSGSGEVIAESIRDNKLPSLKGLNFPADDIPETARQLYLHVRMRSLVDVSSGLIGFSPLIASSTEEESATLEEISYRPLDSCHAEYLTAMGVKSSVVLPILHYDVRAKHPQEKLWGLLVSHNTTPRSISREELEILQWVVDQVSIAIAQSALLSQARQWHYTEATINWVSTLLHSRPSIELQTALQETVNALQGCGGRLYIAPYKTNDAPELFTCGAQPTPLEGKKENFIEEHPAWKSWASFKYQERVNPDSAGRAPLVITDLYKTSVLGILTPAFRSTPIRGMLVLPLYYRCSVLGYLSIFRSEIDTETLWAGRFDTNEQQQLPRQSFEAWRELKRGQAQEWTPKDIELAIALSHHFAMAIEQYKLYALVQSLNTNLEHQVEERTAKLQQSLEQWHALERITNQIRSTLDLNTILQTIVREVRNLLNTDRVVIYQFAGSARSKVIVEAVNGNWQSILGVKASKGNFPKGESRLYKRGEVRVIKDVSQANLTPEHREFLQSLQIKADLIVPIGVGKDLWGLLMAQECAAPRDWLSSEIELLQQLADQAAVAIQQAELYEQSRITAASATAHAQKFSAVAKQQKALFGVITEIRESLDVGTIFKATTTEVRRLLDANRVAVFRFAPELGYDYGEFVSEDVQPGWPQVNREIQHYCFGEQYRSGWIQAVADIYGGGLSDCYIKFLEQLQVRASLVVPLPKGDALWGLLCIHQCTAPRPWDPSEIEFASKIAAHLGVALQQAELLSQKEQQTEQLAIALQNLKQTQTQLIQTEKMSSLGQLIAGVAHEINNPVNFISGNLSYTSQYAKDLLNLLQLYQKHYPNPVPEIVEQAKDIELDFLEEDLPKILSSMKIGTDRLHKLVLSLKNFSRLDQSEKQPVDIHEGLESTLLILQHRLKSKTHHPGIGVVKHYGTLPLVECYASQLNQVFMNVLSNAIDALEEYDSTRTPEEMKTRKSQITIRTSVKEVSSPKSSAGVSLDAAGCNAVTLEELEASTQGASELANASVGQELAERDRDCGSYAAASRSQAYTLPYPTLRETGTPSPAPSENARPTPKADASDIANAALTLRSTLGALQESSLGTPQESTSSSGTAPSNAPPIYHVVIQISDNGPGMTQELQSQIFEPFFTTKPIDKGTGLGLSISYQIVVEKHGGIFKCFSEPGQGTEFWIEIPTWQPPSDKH
jgi:GAF domain-containing protein